MFMAILIQSQKKRGVYLRVTSACDHIWIRIALFMGDVHIFGFWMKYVK